MQKGVLHWKCDLFRKIYYIADNFNFFTQNKPEERKRKRTIILITKPNKFLVKFWISLLYSEIFVLRVFKIETILKISLLLRWRSLQYTLKSIHIHKYKSNNKNSYLHVWIQSFTVLYTLFVCRNSRLIEWSVFIVRKPSQYK